MAREATITYEQVASAADSIKNQGDKPTARAVREVLGTGSMATVLKFFQQWQAGQVRQSQAIDDTLDPAIARAISNQLALKVQEATSEATMRLADLQSEAETIIAENERQSVDIEGLTSEMDKLNANCAALSGRNQQLDADIVRLKDDLANERQEAEHARTELAKAQLRLEAVPRIEAEIQTVRAELEVSRKAQAMAEQSAAVAIAQRDAAEAKATEAADREAIANARVIDADKNTKIITVELSTAQASEQAAKAHVTAGQREIDDLLEQRKITAQELKKQEDKIHRIEAERNEAQKEAKDVAIVNAKLLGEIEALRLKERGV